mmetsp:Transcript_129707/g.361257  ORF Transcript_129707/g.361257 Transcript_129707/m.361257 type:complete len:299 (-) Transcript_129707:258-1154(-)
MVEWRADEPAVRQRRAAIPLPVPRELPELLQEPRPRSGGREAVEAEEPRGGRRHVLGAHGPCDVELHGARLAEHPPLEARAPQAEAGEDLVDRLARVVGVEVLLQRLPLGLRPALSPVEDPLLQQLLGHVEQQEAHTGAKPLADEVTLSALIDGEGNHEVLLRTGIATAHNVVKHQRVEVLPNLPRHLLALAKLGPANLNGLGHGVGLLRVPAFQQLRRRTEIGFCYRVAANAPDVAFVDDEPVALQEVADGRLARAGLARNPDETLPGGQPGRLRPSTLFLLLGCPPGRAEPGDLNP